MNFQKIFTAKQIKEVDNQTIINQNITSEALMERAAGELFRHLIKHIEPNQPIYIFCGTGNNGGDGLVLARLFLKQNHQVNVFRVKFSPEPSKDYAINQARLKAMNISVTEFGSSEKRPPENAIIIDAVFGTGLSRPSLGIAAEATDFINRSDAKVYSVDVPSGLYVDRSNHPDDRIVKADKVFTFQFPKMSFFFPENSPFVPDFEVVDIGLDQEVIRNMPSHIFLLDDSVKNLLRSRNKFAHKNHFGMATIVGGSYGMMGACVLATRAALRIGAGLVSAVIPKCGYEILQTAVPESMCTTSKKRKHIDVIKVSPKTNAVAIGMGMGIHKQTVSALSDFLQDNILRMILDADALNILSQHPELLALLPEKTIITPHLGEFKRLAGDWKNDQEKIDKQMAFAQKHNLIVVLKGAYTSITDGTNLYINPVANPALATAGSGDVLSGMIAGLLAQNYPPLDSALLGVYLHSQTAEKYVSKYNSYSMTAMDIVDMLRIC